MYPYVIISSSYITVVQNFQPGDWWKSPALATPRSILSLDHPTWRPSSSLGGKIKVGSCLI